MVLFFLLERLFWLVFFLFLGCHFDLSRAKKMQVARMIVKHTHLKLSTPNCSPSRKSKYEMRSNEIVNCQATDHVFFFFVKSFQICIRCHGVLKKHTISSIQFIILLWKSPNGGFCCDTYDIFAPETHAFEQSRTI